MDSMESECVKPTDASGEYRPAEVLANCANNGPTNLHEGSPAQSRATPSHSFAHRLVGNSPAPPRCVPSALLRQHGSPRCDGTEVIAVAWLTATLPESKDARKD